MRLAYLSKYKYPAGVALLILLLVIYKLKFLGLPYFWDEAWPYGVGVRTLYNHGLSIMPGAIDPFIARGHPLVFHFLAALWMHIFGTGLYSGHSFALMVSVTLIISIFIFCKTFFSERIGLISCILFGTQAMFISQSSFLMPEVLMALWSMLCFFAYFKNKRILFILCTTAMLLTKESGAVLVFTLGFTAVYGMLIYRRKPALADLQKIGLIALPVLLAFIYFVIQRIQCGFFLYPFYMNYIATGWMKITSDLPSELAYLFVYEGRNGITFFILASFIAIAFSKKWRYTEHEKSILPVFACFILFYLLFSSVNYYISRYLLSTFPPFIICSAVLIDKVFSVKKIVFPLIVAGLVFTGIYFYLHPGKGIDGDMSYAIKKDKQIVTYFEQNKLNNRYILATSVLRIDFSEPYAGYLAGNPFKNIQSEFSDSTEYCVITSEENEDELYKNIKAAHQLKLIQRLQQGPAWAEIYKVVK